MKGHERQWYSTKIGCATNPGASFIQLRSWGDKSQKLHFCCQKPSRGGAYCGAAVILLAWKDNVDRFNACS